MTGVIDIDQRSTWPTDLASAIEIAARDFDLDALQRTRSTGIDESRMRALLRGNRVRAFHCTRLLEHEVEMVRSQGLRLLTEELIKERLDRARDAGAITDEEHAALLKGNALKTKKGRAERLGKSVCFVLFGSRTESADCAALLETWGGEGIYNTRAASAHLSTLKRLGRQTIVSA
jgi:hypothetical protein